jgi:anti-anti-sigma regulatory factor
MPFAKNAPSEAPSDLYTIGLAGLVGIARVRELRERALDAARSGVDVAIDCIHVRHLDASSVQVLLSLRSEVVQNGRRFSLLAVDGSLATRLTAWGFGDLLSGPLSVRAQMGARMPTGQP